VAEAARWKEDTHDAIFQVGVVRGEKDKWPLHATTICGHGSPRSAAIAIHHPFFARLVGAVIRLQKPEDRHQMKTAAVQVGMIPDKPSAMFLSHGHRNDRACPRSGSAVFPTVQRVNEHDSDTRLDRACAKFA
jgi:hypothetical protein